MERTKHRITLLVFILITLKLNAGFRSDIYNAYVTNRMEKWKEVIDRMNLVDNKTNELLVELVNYQYGYIGYCIGFNKKTEAKKYLELAEQNIEALEDNQYDLSLIHAYKCAFYGFRIGLNKLSAPVNGLKSLEYGRSALELDENNYFAWIQYGNIQFHMPAAFGGSKKEGIEYFLKAKELLEREQENQKGNWNYLSLLVTIGQSYTYIDDLNSAKEVYEEILQLEPDFVYVKDELYPALLKIMNK